MLVRNCLKLLSCVVIETALDGTKKNYLKATITQLSPRFFCTDAALLCEFESDKIWINEFEKNRSR